MLVDVDGVIEFPVRLRAYIGGFRIEHYASIGTIARHSSGFLLRDTLALAAQFANLEARIRENAEKPL